jgi:hypothetical protein
MVTVAFNVIFDAKWRRYNSSFPIAVSTYVSKDYKASEITFAKRSRAPVASLPITLTRRSLL